MEYLVCRTGKQQCQKAKNCLIACNVIKKYKFKMPIKKTPNHLNLRQDSSSHVLNFFTNSKKAHFSISEGKLYEELDNSAKTINRNYQVHLTTYPFIAVQVLYGATFPDDEQHIEKIRQTLESVMQNYLKNI